MKNKVDTPYLNSWEDQMKKRCDENTKTKGSSLNEKRVGVLYGHR